MINQNRILVKRLGRGKFEIVEIAYSEILYSKIDGGTAVYYTKDAVAYHDPSTLEELNASLAAQGNFRQVDRCYFANLDQVKAYDDQSHVLRFEGKDYVPMSGPYIKQFKAEGLIETGSTYFRGCQALFDGLNA